MSSLEGLKIALCQMNVVPGRPGLNIEYMVKEIQGAVRRGNDLIIFPELCTTGYFIGDEFENKAFILDTVEGHKKLLEATKAGITAIFGSVVTERHKTGENGFTPIRNAGIVYTNGSYAGHAIKTLLPNYRIFDDERHFYSNRKLAEELKQPLLELLQPINIQTKNGPLRLGLTLCEDIWDENYPLSPVGLLAKNGAELLINLSASPWTWQKNRKRHQIIKDHSHMGKPVIYVNNAGVQNPGKNIVVFDGCSTIYNRDGQPIFEAPAFTSGTFDFVYQENSSALTELQANDSRELFEACKMAITEQFKDVPAVIIGLSGGIDSATTAALYTHCLGRGRVFGISMPMPASKPELQKAARELAYKLKIAYEIVDISELVAVKSALLQAKVGTLTYENLQARTRMDILATGAQQLGGIFTANFNKVEQAFGYGTLGGDMEGAFAVLGDMVKREVYQLADYLNKEVYKEQVIPEASFDEAPTADLKEGQKDPFDYGNMGRRGYHDEMVRAFTEFRRDPEWFLEMYRKKQLEVELRLEPGTLKRLFGTSFRFVKDLEKHWKLFKSSYFKRIQAPPVLIVSKRAFGSDLRESMASPHLTAHYQMLKSEILIEASDKIAVYGSSTNPPVLHHSVIAAKVAERLPLYIIPCGPREDKASSGLATPEDKSEMSKRAFSDIGNTEIDNYDLENKSFTPAYLVDERYKARFPDKEIWHVVGGDLIAGGREGKSEIQTKWRRGEWVWENLNFLVTARTGFELLQEDLPPNAMVIEVGPLFGSSTMVRERLAAGLPIEDILLPEVWEYIQEKGLYGCKRKEN